MRKEYDFSKMKSVQGKYTKQYAKGVTVMKALPILYQKGKGGAIFTWRIWTEGANVITEYGQKDGKKQQASYKAEPKNAGRSNATTADKQAEAEAKAMWQHKLDRKYSKTEKEANERLFLPMLAHSFAEHPQKADFPVDVQPKLDGVRCMAYWDGKQVQLMSRSGKSYNVSHIAKALEPYLSKHDETVLDGEIYLHNETLQGINRLVKKQRENSKDLNYCIYDIPIVDGNDDLAWEERNKALATIPKNMPSVYITESTECKDKNEVKSAQLHFVENGFEGAMIRNRKGKYVFGHRSYDLLKVKSFFDKEFKITSITDGQGKMVGKCVFTCQADGGTFECTIKAPMDERELIYRHREKYIGKMLTVRYQYMTEDEKPFLPVGIAIRMDEDQ